MAAGSALGLAAAYWVIELLTSLIPANMMAQMPYSARPRPECPCAGFRRRDRAAAAAVLFAVTPMLQLSLVEEP